jgi:hypothetical protein
VFTLTVIALRRSRLHTAVPKVAFGLTAKGVAVDGVVDREELAWKVGFGEGAAELGGSTLVGAARQCEED